MLQVGATGTKIGKRRSISLKEETKYLKTSYDPWAADELCDVHRSPRILRKLTGKV
jgi:hypothetical protein